MAILVEVAILVVVSFNSFHLCNSFQFSTWSARKHLCCRYATMTDEILEAVKVDRPDDDKIKIMLGKLEQKGQEDDENARDRFEKLIGLYEVSYVKTTLKGDNPVGGKWTRKNGLAQKILKTRRTFQHILPVNSTVTHKKDSESIAEAVNVVSLDALWGWARLTVILRGDVVPLSLEERTNTSRVVQPLTTRSVKALFDPPRIILGKTGRFFNVNLGPATSVLLDTLYCDEKLRIGMGGTSGTRFLFGKCPSSDAEANEFLPLLKRPPASKKKVLLVLGTVLSSSIYSTVRLGMRFTGGTLGLLSILVGSLLITSSGGIERDDRSVQFRKEEQAVK
mmetsp:Transcript_1956/g.2993  ORF Transcript_1956/g.2993 Transcript_1956/m.2993 type:complete len:336 (+) Transcript_1956:91-1098(+)